MVITLKKNPRTNSHRLSLKTASELRGIKIDFESGKAIYLGRSFEASLSLRKVPETLVLEEDTLF